MTQPQEHPMETRRRMYQYKENPMELQPWVDALVTMARQVELLRQERDEARREVCDLICDRDKEDGPYKYFVANSREWDCWSIKR